MNYFDYLTFEKGIITVLGVNEDNNFIKALKEFLAETGSVTVTDEIPTKTDTDYVIVVPDKNADKRFIMHTKEQVELYKNSGFVIGIVDISIMEQPLADVIVNPEEFAKFTDLAMDELVFMKAIASVVEGHEKYDLMYIDNVCSESKRYVARELAKRHQGGMGVKMISTDAGYVENLIAPATKKDN